MAMEAWLVFSTVPPERASELARALVERGLAACVNILPAVRSCYRWQGQVETADESLLLIKCGPQAVRALQEGLRELHPYELPEIIAVPIEAGLPAYLQWLAAGGREA